jgi:hypothetical protein
MPLRKCIATKVSLLLALLCAGAGAGAGAQAESVGVVTDLNGSLLAKSANGAIKVLALNSSLEQGDTVASRTGTYARLTLADHSDVTLGPDTELRIEKYSFHETGPLSDGAVLSLIKGRVQIAAGQLGKRNNENFILVTPSATIDIHGSIFIAHYVAPEIAAAASQDSQRQAQPAAAMVAVGYVPAAAFRHVSMRSFNTEAPLLLAQNTVGASPAGLNPGLYVQVLDGAIHLTNGGGTQNFAAGQFGYTPSFQQPPVILPANPGMQFTPPPSFSPMTSSQSGTSAAKPGNVDCQVR